MNLEEAIEALTLVGLKANIIREKCLVFLEGGVVESYDIWGGLNETVDPETGMISFEYGFHIFETEKDKYVALLWLPETGQVGKDQEIPTSLEENVNWVVSNYKEFIK